MKSKESVFERTYEDYLARLAQLNLQGLEDVLGVQVDGDVVIVTLYGRLYRVSTGGIQDPFGKRPPLDICVILSKYLLMCPPEEPAGREWISYKDFRDSGPLTTYFSHDVEQAIADRFAGRPGQLQKASEDLGGLAPEIEAIYDLSVRFQALPRVPVLMLFNDRDEEFGATCSVLLERCADRYLDPESLAVLGRLLFTYLKKRVENAIGS
ncbi:MAG: DUF3786 domain-containing protein [Desulfatiglandaceae bacterium]